MSDFFQLETPFGTCQVAKTLEHLNTPWEVYLAQRKYNAQTDEEITSVSGVSVRGWIFDLTNDGIKVLLGQRAQHDSSPNRFEPWGGKCDPGEIILQTVIRETYEETNLFVSIIYEQLGDGQIFFASKSKRWVKQLHFLVEAKSRHEFRLSQEHQKSVWACVSPFPQHDFPLTDGSFHFLELGGKSYKKMLTNCA